MAKTTSRIHDAPDSAITGAGRAADAHVEDDHGLEALGDDGKTRQSLGPKGSRTRHRIMAATEALLQEHPLGDVRITEIARTAGIRQPNFYTYFSGVEDVILAIGEELVTQSEALHDHLDVDWTGEDGFAHARQFVEACMRMWGDRQIVLALIMMLADRRHGGFAALRIRQMRTLYKGFERKVREAQAQGRVDPYLKPRMVGYECVGIVRSLSARLELMMASGFTHEEMIDTSARILYLLVTGRPAPPPKAVATAPST